MRRTTDAMRQLVTDLASALGRYMARRFDGAPPGGSDGSTS